MEDGIQFVDSLSCTPTGVETPSSISSIERNMTSLFIKFSKKKQSQLLLGLYMEQLTLTLFAQDFLFFYLSFRYFVNFSEILAFFNLPPSGMWLEVALKISQEQKGICIIEV